MRLIDLDANKEYLLDGKYAVSVIEPCEDAISRESAIRQIVNTPTFNQDKGQDYLEGSATRQNEIIDILKSLPSVAPSRPSGEWTPYEFGDDTWHKCSVCGVADQYKDLVQREDGTVCVLEAVRNFCPNCGADMKGADNE